MEKTEGNIWSRESWMREVMQKTPELKLREVQSLLTLASESPYQAACLAVSNTCGYSQLLYSHHFDLASLCIERVIEERDQAKEVQKTLRGLFFEILKIICKYTGFRKQHYDFLFRIIGRLGTECKTELDVARISSRLFGSLKLLRLMAENAGAENAPQSFHYLQYNQIVKEKMEKKSGITLRTASNLLWPFPKGFTLIMWIHPSIEKGSEVSILFRIRSSTKGFECFMRGEQLFYRIIPEVYTPPNKDSNGSNIGSLVGGRWNYIAIAHTRSSHISKLYIVINNEERELVVDYPKFSKDSLLKELILMENMQGFFTSVIMYDTAVGNASLTMLRSTFVYGLCDKRCVDLFLLSPSEHRFLLTSPCFCDTQGTTCYNLYHYRNQEITLEIIGLGGVVSEQNNYIDSILNIIPYFNFCCLLGETKGRKMLNLTLKLSLQYLNNLFKTYNEHIRLTKESQKFFQILTHLFSKLVPSLPNEETMKILSEFPVQFPTFQTQILKCMLGSINFWVNIEPKLQAIFWEILKANYACDPKKYSSFININSIIRIMENMDKSLEDGECCKKHQIIEKKKVNFEMEGHYEPIKSLMKFIMINNSSMLKNDFYTILNHLEKRPSPCMFNSLVLLLRDVIENNPKSARMFEQIRGFHQIFRLGTNYPLDIKIMCISLGASAFNYLISDPNFVVREFIKPIIPLLQQDCQLSTPKKELNPKTSHMTQKSQSEQKLTQVDMTPKRKNSSELPSTRIIKKKSLLSFNTTIRKRSKSNPNYLELKLSSPLKEIRTSEVTSNSRMTKRPRIYSELEDNTKGFETSTRLLKYDSPNKTIEEISIYKSDPIDNQTTWLYLTLMQWLTGGKIEKILFSMKNGKQPPNFDNHIVQSEVAFLIISLIKKQRNRNLLELFVTNLNEIANSNEKSAMQIVCCQKIMKFFNSILQSQPEKVEDGSTLWELEIQILCQSTLNLGIWPLVVQKFFLQANQLSQVHPGTYRNIREDEIGVRILAKKWVELSKFFSSYIGKDSTSHTAVYGLNGMQIMEGIFQFILMLSFSRGKVVLIKQNTSPFAGSETSNEYKLLKALDSIGSALTASIEKMSDIVINTFNYSEAGKILQNIILLQKDAINPHILRILDFINKDGHTSPLSKENYFTNYYIIALYMGLTGENSELTHWTTRIIGFGKFLLFMLEFCKYFNFKKHIRILSDDLLLLFSINLKLFISTNLDPLKNSLTELFRMIFQFAEAMPKGYTSEFIRKTLTQNSKHAAALEKLKKYIGEPSNWELQILLDTNSFVIKSLTRLTESSLLIIKSDIDSKYKGLLKYKKEIKNKNEKLAKKYTDFLLDTKMRKYSIDYIQEENSIIQFEIERLLYKRKWKKLQKSLKQWQGSWRDYELFLHPEKLPLTLSEHRFANQCRCLMKIRYSRTDYLKPSDFPESYQSESKEFYELLGAISVIQHHRDSKRTSPLLKGAIKQDWSSEKIARALYQGLATQYQDALPQPLNCELFTPLVAKKGKVMILLTRHPYIVFIFETIKTPIKDERLMFNYSHYKRKKVFKRWKIRNIKAVYRKYIVETSSALEIQYSNGKNVLYNFTQEDERELFLVKLSRLYKDLKFGVLDKSNKISAATDDWVNWRMSTFDYVMLLNNYSGRSYLNISQYPVYPWVIEDLQRDENKLAKLQLRDLTKNVGMMGEKARAEEFKLRFAMDDMGDMGRFHFGSHFSNPGIVFQYLMRIFPFFEAYVKFFSGLDDPNRMFHSIEESLRSAKKDPSDVRELIPEFFSFPDMLFNREHFKLGVREEDNDVVDDVRLPPWANRSPFTYVALNREALESDEASQSISNWFDLLFGFKQRGKEAEKAFNLYPNLSYDAGKILAKTEKDIQEAYKMQAYHWGQSPLQLFTKRHIERAGKVPGKVYSLCDLNSKPSFDVKEEELKLRSFYQRIIKIITFEEAKKIAYFITISLDGKIQDVTVDYVETAEGVTPFFTKLSPRDYHNNYFADGWNHLDPQVAHSTSFPIVYAKKKGMEMIAQGGYRNGSIQITMLTKIPSVQRLYSHQRTCNCLEIDRDYKLAISGSITGEIIVYYIEENLMWVQHSCLRHQGGHLNYLNLNDEMQLFCTSNEDSSVCVYTKSASPKLMRVFHHPQFLSVDYALLAQNPLPCIVMFSRSDSMLNVFSLSGDFLYNGSDTTRDIISPVIGNDSNFGNYLMYIKDKDNIFTVRKLPTLERRMLATKKKATCIGVFNSQKLAIIGRDDGRFDMVWDKKAQSSFSSKLPLTF